MATEERSGGKVNYYLVKVRKPRRTEQPAYQAECEDIIAALQMTFDEGCAFKSLWRTAAARLGAKKAGLDPVYEGEKLVHYGRHILTKARQEKEDAEVAEWQTQEDAQKRKLEGTAQ